MVLFKMWRYWQWRFDVFARWRDNHCHITCSFIRHLKRRMRERGDADPWPSSQAVWQEWLVEAIGKIKGQKQRPSAERICHAVRQTHMKSSGPVLRDELIVARLNQAVLDAKILKVCNKGQTSYKEPNHHTRQLVLTKGADLTKVPSIISFVLIHC